MIRVTRILVTATVVVLLAAEPALAASGPIVHTADVLGIGGFLGGVFGTIGHAVLGAFSWTFQLAAKFILVTLAAVARLLIPRSWASEGVHIMQWIVQIPDYAGQIASPGGGHAYGFAGVNDLRDLFMWIGAAILPLTLVYATSRAMIGAGDPVAVPVARVVALAGLLVFYPYWWGQLAAAINQVTYMVLSLPPVVTGLHKLMLYAVDGAALGGWQLVDLGLMIGLGLQLLALIFFKVVVILAGALLYATGPLMLGLSPTRAGETITRAWASAAAALLALPVLWAAVFAVGALLIGDAGTAGPLIAGQSGIGQLIGGLLLALAGLASLWACLRLAREAGGLLRIQLGAMLAAAHSTPGRSGAVSGAPASGPAHSIRSFTSRVSRAGTAANSALAASGSTGAALAGSGRMLAGVGRRGMIGSTAAAGRAGAAYAAAPAAALLGRSRAGAVAVQMARAGTASWQKSPTAPASTPASAPGRPRGAAPGSPTAGAPTPGMNPGSRPPSSRENGSVPRPSAPAPDAGASSRVSPRPTPPPASSPSTRTSVTEPQRPGGKPVRPVLPNPSPSKR